MLDHGLPQCHHQALGHLRAPAMSGALLEQCPWQGDMPTRRSEEGCQHLMLPPLPHPRHSARDTKVLQKAFTMQQSCWQPGTRANPTITNQGVSQRQKNNSARKQISGSGCQGVITLNNRQSIISTVMRDVLTVSFSNGKQADRFRRKDMGKRRRKHLPRSSTRS